MNIRVLIAEDIEDNRAVMAAYFRIKTNWEVSFARNGVEALAMFDSAVNLKVPFDCVVLDIAMPDMTGLLVARHIRDSGSQVPIIFCTAYDKASNRHGAQDVGAADYLTKPITGEELQGAIEKALTQ